MNKAIFLDRDGVLNKELINYVKEPSELEIFPDIVTPLKKLKDYGFLLIVITNQSAINRGLTSHEKIHAVHSKLQNFLKKNNTMIDSFFYCPHKPEENCICRKPNNGLLLNAIKEFSINPLESWMVGDNDSSLAISFC